MWHQPSRRFQILHILRSKGEGAARAGAGNRCCFPASLTGAVRYNPAAAPASFTGAVRCNPAAAPSAGAVRSNPATAPGPVGGSSHVVPGPGGG